jgi:hypothetical protein
MRRAGPTTLRRNRLLRRLGMAGASVILVGSATAFVLASVALGAFRIPVLLPQAAFITGYPLVTAATAVALFALRTLLPHVAAAVDSALPCSRPRPLGAPYAGRVLDSADVADNLLIATAATLWAASLAGPIVASVYGSYLGDGGRMALAIAVVVVGAAHAAAVAMLVLRVGLYAYEAYMQAKRLDATGGGAIPPVSATGVLMRLLLLHTVAGAAMLGVYYTFGGNVHGVVAVTQQALWPVMKRVRSVA